MERSPSQLFHLSAVLQVNLLILLAEKPRSPFAVGICQFGYMGTDFILCLYIMDTHTLSYP